MISLDFAAFQSRFEPIPVPTGTDWYRFGDGFLGFRSDDEEFSTRFDELYRECRCPAPEANGESRLCYSVRALPAPSVVRVDVEGSSLDLIEFALFLFSGRGYVEVAMGKSEAGWRGMAPEGSEQASMAFGANIVMVDGSSPWQRFIANLAVNQILGQQPGLLCYHGASMGVGGRGMLLVGAKGAGKTSIAMALAARGHDFLGDEIAALRARTRELIPFRRSLSIRPGPAAAAVRQALDTRQLDQEVFPDGTTRTRAYTSDLFPQSGARPAPLESVVVLRGFGEQTRLTRFHPGRGDWSMLSPLGCSLWGGKQGARTMQILTLFSHARCYFLESRSVDEAADLLENLPED